MTAADMTAADPAATDPAVPNWTRLLAGYVRPHRGAVVAAGTLLLLSSLLGLLQPLAAKGLIDALGAGRGVGRELTVLTALVVVAAVLLGVGNYLMLHTAEAVVLDGRRGLVAHLLRLTVPAMRSQAPGDLLARVTTDTMLLRQIASQALIDLFTGGLLLLGALALMAAVDAVLLGVTVIVVVVVAAALGAVMPRIRTAALRAQESVGDMGSALDRALGAFTTVKASGTEAAEEERVDAAARVAYREGVSLARWGSVAGTAAGLAIQVAFLVVLGAGGARVASGAMSVSSLVAFLLYVAYLAHPLVQLVGAGTALQIGRAALTRLGELRALPTEPLPTEPLPTEPLPAEPLPAEPLPTGARPARRRDPAPASVVFEEVSFRYPARSEPALLDFSLTVPAGGLTALVGPSGAGKSTVLGLIERFYQPQHGRVLVDGRDLADWGLRELRAVIGYVEQDVAVLAGSLRENVAYATPGASDAEVRAVLRTTRLDPLLERLGGDLDAPVGHRGVALSGGERQRVAIARALLRRPRLLLLDEATSQLDAVNEASLRDTVRDIAGHTTVVVVAHRLSTVVGADQIVVMQDGRARSTGAHAALVRDDALYAELASEQALT